MNASRPTKPMKFGKFTLLVSSLFLTLCANAAESKTTEVKSVPAETPSLVTSFRCEKFTGSLGDLKLKMIETCNLDKPFSSSLTRTMGGEEVYMFCCHKAK